MTIQADIRLFFQRIGRLFGLATREDLSPLWSAIERSERSHQDWHRQIASITSAVVQKVAAEDMERRFIALHDQLNELKRSGIALSHLGSYSATEPPQKAYPHHAFYRALERQFRGSAQQIKDRQAVYEPWFQAFVGQRVADIGCGSGEWLSLLREWGIRAVGVEVNALNVEELMQAGHPDVVHDDALSWLKRQPSASLAAITGFHVVEHWSLDTLLDILNEAYRVLQPNGLLLLETPNPENIFVATQSFWLDPTHVRPLPPELLKFVVEYSGFKVEKVLRLNPPETAPIAHDHILSKAICVGRDYAVVANRLSGSA